MTKLTEHEQKVLAAFDVRDMDISISLLYMRIYGHEEWQKVGTTSRKMQQKLAPRFKELNEKLKGMQIELGHYKRTYRLTTGK